MAETAAVMGAAILGSLALFGDGATSDWAQAAGSAILGAGAFGSSWINLQMMRDRLRYDAAAAVRESELKAAQDDAKDAKEEVAVLREALRRVGGDVRKVKRKVKEVERRAESHHPGDGPSPSQDMSDDHEPLPPDGDRRST
ncbi:MAG TPA: hypothetical protein VD866_32165 [Urbifossiella sp.]|nr:hypothetical protein [Urbifossiella sp.]